MIGTPAAIRDMQDAQVDAMGSGTVGLEGLGYGTDCVRELLLTRQYRNQGTLSQCSMADLTTSRSTGWVWSRLQSSSGSYSDAYIAWLLLFSSSPSRRLCLRKRSQSADVADLSLSTGEHSRTMYSRDDIHLCCQRTDLGDLHGHPDACDLSGSSCGRSSSDTDKQPRQELPASPRCQQTASSSFSVI